MSLSEQFNIGARIHARTALVNTSITQSSATAATTQDGVTIDRQESGLGQYYSCKAIVSGAFGASSSMQTATLTMKFQHSEDGTTWENYSTGTEPTAAAWGSTGGTIDTTGVAAYNTVEQSVNLNGANRYIRVQVPAPTFGSCSSGHFFNVHGVVVLGGADTLPAV